MNNQIQKLRDVFNEVDPAGVYFQDNKNEYDAEINELVSLMGNWGDADTLLKQLQVIFRKYFTGMEISDEALKLLAKKITAGLQTNDSLN